MKYLDLLGDDQTNVSGSFPLNKLAWNVCGSRARLHGNEQRHESDPSEMARILLQRGFGVDAEYFGLNSFETLFCEGFEGFGGGGGSPQSEKMLKLARVLIRDGGQDPSTKLRVRHRDYSKNRRDYWLVKMTKPWCALHVSYGEMTQMLLENGADPNIQDQKGNTALDVCIGTEKNMFEIGDHRQPEEAYQTAMTLLLSGGRLSRRGKEILPVYLDHMSHLGYQFPDTLVEYAQLDGAVFMDDVDATARFHIPRITSLRSKSPGGTGSEIEEGSKDKEYRTHETLTSSKPTSQTRIKGKIREIFSRRKEPKG